MNLRPIFVPALCLMLAACASATQIAQRDSDRCTATGYRPDSKEFNDCMLRLETERKIRTDARHREMMERSSAPWAR
jgi:hypothetical protein